MRADEARDLSRDRPGIVEDRAGASPGDQAAVLAVAAIGEPFGDVGDARFGGDLRDLGVGQAEEGEPQREGGLAPGPGRLSGSRWAWL